MYSGMPRSISSRTGSPKRRRRSSDSIARSRSSASSSCRSRSASRVTRKRYESRTCMPGKSTSRWCEMRSSSSTKRRSPLAASPTGTKRGSVGGIFTRAKWSSIPSRVASSSSTASESDRFEMYGKGWPLSTASGVSTGKTLSSKVRSSALCVSSSSSETRNSRMPSRSSAGSSSSLRTCICRGSDVRSRCEIAARCSVGRAAVFRTAHDLGLDLLLDRRHANHEELVEVGSVDRDELQAARAAGCVRQAPLRARGH